MFYVYYNYYNEGKIDADLYPHADPVRMAQIEGALMYHHASIYPAVARACYPTLGFPQYPGGLDFAKMRFVSSLFFKNALCFLSYFFSKIVGATLSRSWTRGRRACGSKGTTRRCRKNSASTRRPARPPGAGTLIKEMAPVKIITKKQSAFFFF